MTENDWHVAFNEKVAHGIIAVVVPTGRVDILTDRHAIEVDRVRNYRAGVKQALQYATLTGRKPGLALYIDGDEDTLQSLDEARTLCVASGVEFWLINEYVSHGELANRDSNPDNFANPQSHWINEDSGVRHNRNCRWFGNTGNGRYCDPDEGRACRQCGGDRPA